MHSVSFNLFLLGYQQLFPQGKIHNAHCFYYVTLKTLYNGIFGKGQFSVG